MKKTLSCFLSVLLFSCLISIKSFAIDTGFSTAPISQSEQDYLITVSCISFFKQEPIIQPFQYFDINEKGWIALGVDTPLIKTVCVYSDENEFQYGYRFVDCGTYRMEWSGDTILIYTVRGDIIYVLNDQGDCTEVLEIEDAHQSQDYWRELIKNPKTIQENTYYARQNSNATLNVLLRLLPHSLFYPYFQIVKTDVHGVESVIYSATDQIDDFIFRWIQLALLTAVLVILAYSIKLPKNQRNANKEDRKRNTGN